MTEARMQETPDFKPGTFCWVELATTNANAAKSFYTQLFGWTFTDNPVSPDMVYTMLQLDGKDVGALFQMVHDKWDLRGQAESFLRPLLRRRFSTLRPPAVAMRERKPWRRLRTSLLG